MYQGISQLGDYAIYGKFNLAAIEVNARETSQVLAKCFGGMNYPTCMPDFDSSGQDPARHHPEYTAIADNYGSVYCLSCCGTHQEQKDIWDLYCDMDLSTAAAANKYAYELRLGANQFDGDETLVRCPLPRSACTYADDGITVVSCNIAGDNTYLVGYKLTIVVQEYSQNLQFWRGVKSCSIEAMESDTPLGSGDQFREYIVLEHPVDWNNLLIDAPRPLIFLCFIVFVAYIFLKNCRRDKCVYCQEQLVWSKEMCIRCRIIGAEPPDPVLLEALEAKGQHLQGPPTERFPGEVEFYAWCFKQLRRLLSFTSGLYRCVTCSKKPARVAIDETTHGDESLDNAKETDGDVEKGGERKKAKQKEGEELKEGEGSMVAGGETKDDNEQTAVVEKDDDDDDLGVSLDVESDLKNAGVVATSPKKWKYPKWMVKLGFSNKKKQAKQKPPNPHLLHYPRHIIYAAVRHHAPPPPDETMDAERRRMYIEEFGYMPGEEYDDEGNLVVHDKEDDLLDKPKTGPMLVGLLAKMHKKEELNKVFKRHTKRYIEPSMWQRFWMDYKVRRAFKKKKNTNENQVGEKYCRDPVGSFFGTLQFFIKNGFKYGLCIGFIIVIIYLSNTTSLSN